MRRMGSLIRLRPEREDEYVHLHRDVWPEVLARLSASHVTNYTIFLRDGWLFSYLEYTGEDFEADMAALAADPRTREWWQLTDPCQQRLDTAVDGEQWSEMAEVFHCD